jgi:hypothetical protein
MTNAKTKEEKDNAQAALERAQAAINQRMASKEYNDMMQYGTAEQKAAIASQVQGYQGLQGAQKAAQEANGDYAAGLKNQKVEAAAVQKGQKVDADGKPIMDSTGAAVMDEGTKTAQALNAANRQATIQAGGVAQAMEKANTALSKSPTAINAFNDALKFVGTAKNMEQARVTTEQLPANVVKAAFGDTGMDKTEAPAAGGASKQTGRITKKVEPTTTREGGTLEKTGSPVEPEDVIAKIHKGETVFSPDAVKNMGIKMSEMSKMVSTTVSSATGATGKSAESPSPKIADSTTAVFEKSIELYKARLEKAVESGNALRISLETKGLERNQQALSSYTQQQLEKREGIEKLGFDAYYAKLNQAKTKEVEAKVMSADELIALDKASIAKAKEAKIMSADELIALDKANIVKTTTAKVTESAKLDTGGLFDMLNPKIINQKAADLQKAAASQTAPKTTEAAPKTADAEAKKKEADAQAKAAADAEARNQQTATAPKPSAGGGDATLKDLKDQLVTLNKNMLQLINHSESTADAANKTAKSTAKAHGAR